jgi:hypothetical protein
MPSYYLETILSTGYYYLKCCEINPRVMEYLISYYLRNKESLAI